ncbi:4178_t:CDS:1, partial [Ambispora gerdemannii]
MFYSARIGDKARLALCDLAINKMLTQLVVIFPRHEHHPTQFKQWNLTDDIDSESFAEQDGEHELILLPSEKI